MIKASYALKDDIPEGQEGLYEEIDGVWGFVGVENQAMVSPDLENKFKEFRDNNKILNKNLEGLTSELAGMKEMYGNIDPEVYNRILRQSEEAAADEDKTLLAQGRVEDVVQRRVKSAIGEVRDELDSKTTAYDELKGMYDTLNDEFSRKQATDHIMGILDSQGHRPRAGAKQDVEDRIASDWTLDEDRHPIPKAGLIGEDGGRISDQEYVRRELLKNRPFYFEEAKGGGGGGGGRVTKSTGIKEIDRHDMDAKGQNIEALASGKAKLT